MNVTINPNKKVVASVRRKLRENGGYCPCSLEKNEDTKCMCKAFRDQVEREESGECYCGLYVASVDTPQEDKTSSDNSNDPVKEQPAEAVSAKDDNESVVGKIIKIKDTAKTFCGGNTIPDWIRKAELYISGESRKGVETIALSDSCTDYDVILEKDIIITDKTRTFEDSEPLLDSIDVRIMGVPSRIDNVHLTQKRLNVPDENIFIDYEHEGCLKNAMRAWSKPTDKEFVMVLQDDIELCDHFAKCCNKIVTAHPDKIIALFQFRLTSARHIPALPSPYVSLGSGWASGQGIIMRSEWIADCLSGWETSGINGDDTNINAWAEKTGKEVITTIPTILQHIGKHSVFSPGRQLGKSSLYSKSAVNANWDNGFVTSINNILR